MTSDIKGTQGWDIEKGVFGKITWLEEIGNGRRLSETAQ